MRTEVHRVRIDSVAHEASKRLSAAVKCVLVDAMDKFRVLHVKRGAEVETGPKTMFGRDDNGARKEVHEIRPNLLRRYHKLDSLVACDERGRVVGAPHVVSAEETDTRHSAVKLGEDGERD